MLNPTSFCCHLNTGCRINASALDLRCLFTFNPFFPIFSPCLLPSSLSFQLCLFLTLIARAGEGRESEREDYHWSFIDKTEIHLSFLLGDTHVTCATVLQVEPSEGRSRKDDSETHAIKHSLTLIKQWAPVRESLRHFWYSPVHLQTTLQAKPLPAFHSPPIVTFPIHELHKATLSVCDAPYSYTPLRFIFFSFGKSLNCWLLLDNLHVWSA